MTPNNRFKTEGIPYFTIIFNLYEGLADIDNLINYYLSYNASEGKTRRKNKGQSYKVLCKI
jgi:hypothetical protein